MTPPQDHDDLPELSLDGMEVLEQEDAVPLVANSALRDILRSLGTAPNFRDCMRECALTLHQWTNADAASVYRLCADGRELVQIHSVGFPRSLTELSRHLPLRGTLTGLAVQERQLLFSQQVAGDLRIPRAAGEELSRAGMRTILAVPLITHADVVGAITLGWRRRLHLSEADSDLLMSIGYGIAIAVENAGS